MAEIFTLADRVTVLRDGEYRHQAVAETSEPELITMMVGRVIDHLFPKLATKPGARARGARPGLAASGARRQPDRARRRDRGPGRADRLRPQRGGADRVRHDAGAPGEIRIDGKPVRIGSAAEAKRHGIAYVPEDRGSQGVIRPMTLRQNVSLAVLRRIARRGFIDRARRSAGDRRYRPLRHPGARAGQIVGKLSGGNQQKVVLGKWLATRPALLIMDEPTRGIDVGAKAEIHRLMSELAAQGLAVLMISSELPEILGMSDRILVMREGIAAEFARAGRPGDHRARHDAGGCRRMTAAALARLAVRRAAAPARQPGGRPAAGPGRLFVGVGAYNPRFLAERNLETIFLGNAYIAVAAIGMSMVIVSGNIDVSVGSLIGVLAVLSGSIAVAGWPIWLSWVVPVLAGMAVTASWASWSPG